MRMTLLAGSVVVLLILSASRGASPPGEPVSKAEDVLGVWRRAKRFASWASAYYMQFRADGTMGLSAVPDKWDYEWATLEFDFEGSRLSVTETAFRGWDEFQGDGSCATGIGAPYGVYEMQLLANGNLRFVDAEDDCYWRRHALTESEWEAVP